MKIISRNINWIRAVIQKWFFERCKSENPDIICLQEVKAFENQIPPVFFLELWDYEYVWHKWTRAGYAWTAIFFKKDIKTIEKKSEFLFKEFSDEWRITELDFKYWDKKIWLINWYFPNGWTRADGTEMLTYKLDFYEKMREYIKNLRKIWITPIICGDFNICHKEIDIARPKENENSIWFLPIERAEMDKLENDGLIDIYRHFYPNLKEKYTWWSYRAWARPRNIGWRLDYFWSIDKIINNVKWVEQLDKVLWSDHCPIMLELK